MNRWLLAVAVLLGGAVGLASADYVIIIANLGQSKDKPNPNPSGPPGFPPMGAIGVPPGGMIGVPPGGQVGVPPGGQVGVPPGGQVGVPPGGQVGRPPFPGQAGGPFPGQAGAVGAAGGPFPGQAGAVGAAGGPFPGPGQVGAMGAAGGPFPGGQFGGAQGVLGGPVAQPGAPLLVHAVVEVNASYKDLARLLRPGENVVSVTHKWTAPGGSTKLMQSEVIKIIPLSVPTVAKRYDARFAETFKDKQPSTDQVLELADWALTHGLNDKFVEVMNKLAELDKTHKAVVAFQAVEADLKRPITKDASGEALRKRLLEGYKVETGDHYVLIHNLPSGDQAVAKQRVARLESTMRTYYYWFALRGTVLPVPQDRLMTILTDKEPEFLRCHTSLTAAPVVADGFFARRENLSVFSNQRLDDEYDALDKFAGAIWAKGLSPQDLLAGQKTSIPKSLSKEEVSLVETLALLEKAMQNDSELASVSHDGSRQLIYASGLLPRGVSAPEWALFGMGSFFETPLGSPWATPTGPNTTYLTQFREMQKGKKFEASPYETLRRVVTDDYFRDLTAEDLRKNTPAVLKARTATWSLTYFLAQKKLDNLQRYFKELSEMPRDLELGDDVLLETFAKAFDAYKDGKVDVNKLSSLANQWQTHMAGVDLEAEDLSKEILKSYNEIHTQPGGKSGEGPPKPPAP